MEKKKGDYLDNRSFIPNLTRQYKSKPFEKRNGIDFYIDYLRFMPDKSSVCKIYMVIKSKLHFVIFLKDVYDRRVKRVFDVDECYPELESTNYNPSFDFRRELRKDHIDPTSLVKLTIVTVDKSCNQNRIIGYAAIPLFRNATTRTWPTDHNDQVKNK